MKRARILGNILKIDEIAIGPRLYEAVKNGEQKYLEVLSTSVACTPSKFLFFCRGVGISCDG